MEGGRDGVRGGRERKRKRGNKKRFASQRETETERACRQIN